MKGLSIAFFAFGTGGMLFYKLIDKTIFANAFVAMCVLLISIFLLLAGVYLFFTKEDE